MYEVHLWSAGYEYAFSYDEVADAYEAYYYYANTADYYRLELVIDGKVVERMMW